MIALAPSFRTLDALAAAYRAAGGMIGDAAASDEANYIINCAEAPPKLFTWCSYDRKDQIPNLYKGMLNMYEVTSVQAPSQRTHSASLGVITHELANYEFVGAHAAAWYMKPENLRAFLAVCPSGDLVFLERYRDVSRDLCVVSLRLVDNKAYIITYGARIDSHFTWNKRFAVRRRPAA